jgi:hypothetical protein
LSAGKEVIFMESGLYLSADEIAVLLGVSKGHAYKVIRDCNDELKDDGYITIAGRVPKKYFGRKCYGYEDFMKEEDHASVPRQEN